jgi:hypothetical protein
MSAFGQRQTDGIPFGGREIDRIAFGYNNDERYHNRCEKCKTKIHMGHRNKELKAYNVICLVVVIDPTDSNKNSERYHEYMFCLNCMRDFPRDDTTVKNGNMYRPKTGTVIKIMDSFRSHLYETIFIEKGAYFEIEGG